MRHKIAVYSFSGTGNTKMLADRLIHILQSRDIHLRTYEMDRGAHEPEWGSTHMVVAFPANSGAVSPFVWNFFRSLPREESMRVDILMTLGRSAYVLPPLEKILRAKGYTVGAVSEIHMPENLSRKTPNAAADRERIRTALRLLDQFAENVLSENPGRKLAKGGSRLSSFLARNTGLPWILKRTRFRFGVRKDLCTRCGICVRGCPVRNIEMPDYPEHRSRCNLCMRCAAVCPQNAIYIKGRSNWQVRKAIIQQRK